MNLLQRAQWIYCRRGQYNIPFEYPIGRCERMAKLFKKIEEDTLPSLPDATAEELLEVTCEEFFKNPGL